MPLEYADKNSIEWLYEQHGPSLVLFAAAMTGDRARAQDAVHHVFLRLVEEPVLSRASNARAFLFACVRNAVLNEIKVHDRHVELDPDAPWFTSPARDPAEELTLRRALMELPAEQREVVVLHLWGDFTFLEIAALLEISPNTAASRYRYALEHLRGLLRSKEDSRVNSRR